MQHRVSSTFFDKNLQKMMHGGAKKRHHAFVEDIPVQSEYEARIIFYKGMTIPCKER